MNQLNLKCAATAISSGALCAYGFSQTLSSAPGPELFGALSLFLGGTALYIASVAARVEAARKSSSYFKEFLTISSVTLGCCLVPLTFVGVTTLTHSVLPVAILMIMVYVGITALILSGIF
jgi:hypothetical protein